MTSFAEATAVKALDSHTYTVSLKDDWAIGSVPHGGYVTSCFMAVAKAHFGSTLAKQDQPDCLTLHLEFLRRTSVGPARFAVRDLKLGGQTSTLAVALTQDGGQREEVVGYVTHANLDRLSGLTLDTTWALEPSPAPVDLAALARAASAGDSNPVDADVDAGLWRRLPRQFTSFRRAHLRYHAFVPAAGQPLPAIVDQWLTLSTGERITDLVLGSVVDMFPLMIENYRRLKEEGKDVGDSSISNVQSSDSGTGDKWPAFWYPTLLLNLEVKRRLPPGGVDFLFLRARAKEIRHGRNDIEVVVLDDQGRLLAVSHHVAFILDASRNLAARGGAKGSMM